MAKIGDDDDPQATQAQRDFNDDVRRVLNYGKYQYQTLTAPPGFKGRFGETVSVIGGTTGRIYFCTTDNAATWALMVQFNL